MARKDMTDGGYIREAIQIGKTLPPSDPLIYNSYPSYRNFSDDPETPNGKALSWCPDPICPPLSQMITPFTGRSLLRRQWDNMEGWLLAFGLARTDQGQVVLKLTITEGSLYIRKIYQEALYGPVIMDFLQKILDRDHTPDLYGIRRPFPVRELAYQMKMWIPPREDLNFALEAAFWFRAENSEKPSGLDRITLLDLYLIPGNPFERIPVQTLVSYMDDYQIFERLSQIGPYLLSKEYSRKIDQLRTVFQLSLIRFGHLVVESFNYPIKLRYITQSGEQILGLSDLFEKTSPMVLVRLYLQIRSCSGFIDLSEWTPWLKEMETRLGDYFRIYQTLQLSPISPGQEPPREILTNLDLERFNFPCLICSRLVPSGDFPWCGHGICQTCQMNSGSVKCGFCKEHFVSDNLRHFELRPENLEIGSRIREVQKISEARMVQFDFINQKFKTLWNWSI